MGKKLTSALTHTSLHKKHVLYLPHFYDAPYRSSRVRQMEGVWLVECMWSGYMRVLWCDQVEHNRKLAVRL
jgi:hypothetical protein